MAAAVAAIATPNAAAYEQHQASRQEAASSRQETKTAAATDGSTTSSSSKREGKAAERRSKKEDSRGGSKQEQQQQQQQEGPRFPRSDDPAVQHKLRLLKSAPYTELRAGDWFCGQCGAHNYAFKQLCFRWADWGGLVVRSCGPLEGNVSRRALVLWAPQHPAHDTEGGQTALRLFQHMLGCSGTGWHQHYFTLLLASAELVFSSLLSSQPSMWPCISKVAVVVSASQGNRGPCTLIPWPPGSCGR
jgi:hypothetical protein